jgi:hypothetical protein
LSKIKTGSCNDVKWIIWREPFFVAARLYASFFENQHDTVLMSTPLAHTNPMPQDIFESLSLHCPILTFDIAFIGFV